MTKNELASYFGKNYQTDPSELKGLNSTQKSNFSLIVKKARDLGIKSDFAIAGLLAIVSKESAFKATTEGSYKGTSPGRVRQVFGTKRLSKYNDSQISNFTQSDIDFFDLVYGYLAKEKGFATYGNDNKGDGFRYRGRGFNQLTFKNIYKERGEAVGLDLVGKPELLEQPDSAAAVLVAYYFNAFKGLSKDVAISAGITKQSSGLATINSISSVETAVDLFYLATSGSMVSDNYNKKVLKYKSGGYRNSDGIYVFPNDNLGGYTRARNRAPYFYQILSGNKLPDTPPVSNEPEIPIDTSDETQPQLSDPIEQSDSGDNQDGGQSGNNNQEFNPTQLTQVFSPTIKPIEISLDAESTSKRQKKNFLTGMGTAPVIYYNGIHIEYKDVQSFELYHEGILPAMKMSFADRNGVFKDKGFPTDDSIISIFIYSRSKKLRSIRMDFKISSFKDLGPNEFMMNGVVNLSKVYLRNFKSYSKKTSYEALQDLAKDCEMGFCSNISNTKDKMTWINPGSPNYQFIDNILKNSYLSDESFLSCYVDFYYNLCYVDLEKELNRDNSNDKMIKSNGLNEFTENREKDDDIGSLILSTDPSVKGSNAYISDYIVTNKSTQISLNKAYLTKTKFYDSKSKELLIFDVDSITSEGDKTMILKGKPGEEDFFKDNVTNVWIGKLDKFEDDGSGNAHSNFNYSLIQNEINIDEISKISIEITLPSPNYNLYIYQKVYLALLNQKPGANQESLRYKRLTGDWLITSIGIYFDGKNQQKITLIKRELELDENEREPVKSSSETNNENSGDFNDNPNELSPNDESPNNPVQQTNGSDNPTNSTDADQDTAAANREADTGQGTAGRQDPTPPPTSVSEQDKAFYKLDYIIGSEQFKDNDSRVRNLVGLDGVVVDEVVAVAYLKMKDAAKKEGIKLSIASGFRPAYGPNLTAKTKSGKTVKITTQEYLYNGYIQGKPGFNLAAKPGKSNHGNGIALDLNTGSRKKRSLDEKTYTWLIKNSWKYGFVRTVGGAKGEEWHFEYRPNEAKKGPYAKLDDTENNQFFSDLGLSDIKVA